MNLSSCLQNVMYSLHGTSRLPNCVTAISWQTPYRSIQSNPSNPYVASGHPRPSPYDRIIASRHRLSDFSIHSLIRIASYAMTPKSHMTTKLYRHCRRLTAAPVWLFICTSNRRRPEERRHRRIRITSVPARASVSTLAFASFHGSKSVHSPYRPQPAGRGFIPGPAPVDDPMPSLRASTAFVHTPCAQSSIHHHSGMKSRHGISRCRRPCPTTAYKSSPCKT